MFRTTTSLILGLALLGATTSANAEEYKISLQNKSPTEIQAAISDAALKACEAAYADQFRYQYEYDACVEDSVRDAQSQLRALHAKAAHHNEVVASR